MSIADEAIRQSVARNEIVCLLGYKTVMDDLLCQSEGHVKVLCEDGLFEFEYWGVDEDGSPWRVRVRPDDN